jgi:hypothetical protein
VEIQMPRGVPGNVEILRLMAPSLESIDGIRFGRDRALANGGRITVDLRHASAAVLSFVLL